MKWVVLAEFWEKFDQKKKKGNNKMKYNLYVLAAFMAIFGCFVPQTEALAEQQILDFLEEVRNRMCYPLFGLPALDPLEIKHVEYNMNNKYIIDFSGSLTNFRLTGISDFNVTDLKITTVPTRRSSLEVIMPLTALKSLYTAKGSVAYIVNLNGDGTAEGHVGDLKISISWIFKTGFSIGIRSLRIEISIGDLFLNIEDVIEEPRINDFLHALINEMGIELLNDLWVEAQGRGIIEFIEDTFNNFAGSYSLGDILRIVGGIIAGGGDDEPAFGGLPADCKTKILS